MYAVAPDVTAPPRRLSAGQSIARGALTLVSLQPLTWSASLLGAILIPRLLGSEALGQLTIASTVCVVASTVTGLGISEFMVRRAAQQPHLLRHDQGIALLVQVAAASLGFVLVAVLGWLLATSIVDYRLLFVASISMVVAPFQTVLLSSFRAREEHRNYAWLCAATAVLVSLGPLVVLLAGGDLVASVVTGTALFLATTLAGWKLSGLQPLFPSLNRSTLRECWEFIRAGVPFVSWQITQMAYSQIDRLLLGVLVSGSQVGWYGAANRIIAIPIFIPTLIITPLFPALSRNAHDPDALRRTIVPTLKITLLLTVPLSAGTIVVAPIIPAVLQWPADFSNTAGPMSILALQLPLVAMGMVLGSVLMAIGRERRLAVMAVIATVFNIAANLVAIPMADKFTGNGGIGAAIVTVASEVVMLIGALVFIPKHLLDKRIAWDATRIALAGAATVGIGVALLPVAPLLSVVAGAVAYVGVAALLRVLTIADVRLAAGLLGRRMRSR